MLTPAPTWFIDWRNKLLADRPIAKVNIAAFTAGRTPRFSKKAEPELKELLTTDLPTLTFRVGRKLKSKDFQHLVRLDVDRDGSHVRSYAFGWRPDGGNILAIRCSKDATECNDAAGWVFERKLTAVEQTGTIPVTYEAFERLHDRNWTHSRELNQTLLRLALDLTPADITPPRCPRLFVPGAPSDWLRQVASVIVARELCAALVGKKNWTENGATLVGWRQQELQAFAKAYGWHVSGSVTKLERDLCKRFKDWSLRRVPDIEVELEPKSVVEHTDHQRPDILLVKDDLGVLVEAKLGLTRDSVRTGLSQAFEYAFHLRHAHVNMPVLLLLGEDPADHGEAFAAYVRHTSACLGVPVILEDLGGDFVPWSVPRLDGSLVRPALPPFLWTA